MVRIYYIMRKHLIVKRLYKKLAKIITMIIAVILGIIQNNYRISREKEVSKMSNEPIELKIYKKDNKFYGLSDICSWSVHKIIEFAKQLEKYDKHSIYFCNNPCTGVHKTKHPRLSDYEAAEHLPDGEGQVTVEAGGFNSDGYLTLDLTFSEGEDGIGGVEFIAIKNPINSSKVRLIQKNCVLEPDEREFLEDIMQELGLPTDKASVDNEIKNCVRLYECIQD